MVNYPLILPEGQVEVVRIIRLAMDFLECGHAVYHRNEPTTPGDTAGYSCSHKAIQTSKLNMKLIKFNNFVLFQYQDCVFFMAQGVCEPHLVQFAYLVYFAKNLRTLFLRLHIKTQLFFLGIDFNHKIISKNLSIKLCHKESTN